MQNSKWIGMFTFRRTFRIIFYIFFDTSLFFSPVVRLDQRPVGDGHWWFFNNPTLAFSLCRPCPTFCVSHVCPASSRVARVPYFCVACFTFLLVARVPHPRVARVPHFRVARVPHFCVAGVPHLSVAGVPHFRVAGVPLLRFAHVPHFRYRRCPKFSVADVFCTHHAARVARFRMAYVPLGRVAYVAHSACRTCRIFRVSHGSHIFVSQVYLILRVARVSHFARRTCPVFS